MAIYTQHNTRVERFSQILKNEKYVSSIWLPKFICRIYRSRLVKQFNSLMKDDDSDEKKLINDFYKESLYIRIMIFEKLYRCLNHKATDDAKALFKKHFHREYTNDLLPLLKSKLERLLVQYDIVNTQPVNNTGIDFDEYILYLESISNKSLAYVFIYRIPLEEKEALLKLNQNKTPKKQ